MRPQLLDVVLAGVPVDYSEDRRPCVVVALDGEGAIVVPCSSALDLAEQSRDFWFDREDEDFAGTGLLRTSYAIGWCAAGDLPHVPFSRIHRRIGRVSGDMARRFRDWLRDVRPDAASADSGP